MRIGGPERGGARSRRADGARTSEEPRRTAAAARSRSPAGHRRPSAAPAGDPESAAERVRCDDRGRRPPAEADDRDQS